MGKNITFARALKAAANCVPAVVFGVLCGIFCGISGVNLGCSRQAAAPRAISGHSIAFKGVAHANPANTPLRYCGPCHGAALAGGANFTPSCYQCHGKNWTEAAGSAATSPAPGDHSLALTARSTAAAGVGILHKGNLFTPTGDCDACHGADLGGDGFHPGCYTCHGALWQVAPSSGWQEHASLKQHDN